jgi:hypothetical protein
MRLDRNAKGHGKYAVVNMREIERIGGKEKNPDIAAALNLLELNGLIEYGEPHAENEFFVIKLKDAFAEAALDAYAEAAEDAGHEEYAADVFDLANRASKNSPWCKEPD